MSFKREGNDNGLLDNLRRRRVRELFSEDIPEDEAKLLCNGRLACLVCSHKPVFDTANMLMVHRQGKRHAGNHADFMRKKKDLKALILKRKHEQYMKDGTTNIKQAASSSSTGINFTQPYNPCIKKLKRHDRKPCLDLGNSVSATASDGCSQHLSNSASSSPSIPKSTSQTVVPSRHSHQLKKIFQPAQRAQVPVQPYISKRQNDIIRGCKEAPSPSVSGHCSSSSLLSPLSLASSSHIRNVTYTSTPVSMTASTSSPDVTLFESKASQLAPNGEIVLSKHTVQQNCDTKNKNMSMQPEGWTSLGMADSSSGAGLQSASQSADRDAQKSISSKTADRGDLALKYHQLSGSGWKKDWAGKWIRDENAEFDSDEEAPDLP